MEAKEQEEKERIKIKKRQDRMTQLAKPENPVKHQNQRSEKPAIQRINRNVSKLLTLDEQDYHKYVLGGEENTENFTSKHTSG